MQPYSLDMIILLLPLWVGRRSPLVPRKLRARNEPMLGRRTTLEWALMQLKQDSHQGWELIQEPLLLLMGHIHNKLHSKVINSQAFNNQDMALLQYQALLWELTSNSNRTLGV